MPPVSVAQLQETIRSHIAASPPPCRSETVRVPDAAGRVLAENIRAPLSVPAANVSAMDGYALAEAAAAGSRFEIVGESAAGRPFSGSLKSGGCIRIMTGAEVPPCCTTVVVQENVCLENNGIVLQKDAPDAANIRYAGEEMQAGQNVFAAGRVLRQADVMVLSALGFAEIPVHRKLRVAVLSTGDELAEAGEAPAPGRIFDSNRPMLLSKLRALPVEAVDFGRLPDNLEATARALDEAAQTCDTVITSGGVSVGDYDYLRDAVARIGTIHHYKVAMKPGKPFVFGQMGRAWYFGLPGNPVSGFAGFDIFLRAALWQLAGAAEIPQPLRFQAALSAPVKKAPGRADMQRAVITRNTDGTWSAAPAGRQDSHRILGVSRANAYLVLPAECGDLPAGSTVTVQPFTEAFL